MYALIAAIITTLIAMAEIMFLQRGQAGIWEALCQNPKFYATLAAAYFGVFALGYFLALACVEFAEKIFRRWILAYIFGFAAYFAVLGIILYATGRVGNPQAQEAGILEFCKNFAAQGLVIALQIFTISFAFIRIAKKKISSAEE